MRFIGHRAVLLAAGLAFALASGAASAATVVNVELRDKGAHVAMPTNLLCGTPGIDMTTAPLGIKTSQVSAQAGEVTFSLTNSSKQTVHEMIVILAWRNRSWTPRVWRPLTTRRESV
jgi:uncharacterized cupredoxin-like copper-binding protein